MATSRSFHRSAASLMLAVALALAGVPFIPQTLPVAVRTALANPGPADPGEASELPPLGFILARYTEAVGGAEAVGRLRTRVALMRCVTDLPSRTPPVYEVDTFSVRSMSSGEFVIAHNTARGVMIEGFDGEEGWKVDFDGATFNDQAFGPRDRWMTDPQFPIKLSHYFPDMKVVGVDYRDGEYFYLVDIDGREDHRLGFSTETGLLTWLGYHRELRDYRQVDGVLVPHRVTYGRKGGASTFFIDSLVHNVPLDWTVFSLAR